MDSKEGRHGSHQRHNPSPSELLSSAKLVAEAARATISHEGAKVDKVKVAGAAENILEGASHYGKLEERGFGKYVEKAEDYLHKYSSSNSSSSTNTTTAAAAAAAGHHQSSHSGGGHEQSEGGGHKPSESGGGYGDYMKMAEGFFKKH